MPSDTFQQHIEVERGAASEILGVALQEGPAVSDLQDIIEAIGLHPLEELRAWVDSKFERPPTEPKRDMSNEIYVLGCLDGAFIVRTEIERLLNGGE